MDLQTSKIELVKQILEIENFELIKNISELIKGNDFWNDLSKEEQNEIKFGIDQLDKGKRVSLEDFLKKVS